MSVDRAFRPQRRNANRHTQRGLKMLDDSMSEDGYVTPMTATADGEIIDGSARLEIAADRFADVDPIVIEHDGTRPIIAVRTDIPSADDPRAVRIALRANRVQQVDLDFDPGVLAELAAEDGATLQRVWGSESDLSKLLEEVTVPDLETDKPDKAETSFRVTVPDDLCATVIDWLNGLHGKGVRWERK